MKKRIGRSLLAIALSLCVAVAFSLVIPSGKAGAELMPKSINYAKKMTLVNFKGQTDMYFVNFDKKIKMTRATKGKAKSSKKSVVRVKHAEIFDAYGKMPYLIAKKPGEATVTFTIKKGKKSKTFTSKVTVVNYKNPIKKLKIGNKNAASAFRTYVSGSATINDKTATVKVTPRKGWKVKSIKYYYSTYDENTDFTDSGRQKVRNGSKITLHPGYDEQYMFIVMYNKKQKVTHEMELSF